MDVSRELLNASLDKRRDPIWISSFEFDEDTANGRRDYFQMHSTARLERTTIRSIIRLLTRD